MCDRNEFDIGKTNRRYKEHILEVKLLTSKPKTNFSKHIFNRW